MAIAFRSQTNNQHGSTSSPAPNVPSGAAANDIAVVILWTTASVTLTPPSGFSALAGMPQTAASGHKTYAYWKRLTGSDAGSYTFTSSANQHFGGGCMLFSGCVTSGDPWETDFGVATAAAASAPVDMDTTNVNTMGVLLCGANSGDEGTWATPSGWTAPAGTSINNNFNFGYKALASAGNTGSVSFTAPNSGGGVVSWIGALKPATPDATVSPAAIAAVAAFPTATKQTGSTVSPSAIASVAALPTATKSAGSTVSPAAVAAVAAFPTATKQTGSTVSPATIAALTALPTATKSAGSTVSPAAIASVAAFLSATKSAGSTVSPAVVAGAASFPAGAYSGGAIVLPGVIAALAALPAPSVTANGSVTITPATIAAAVTLFAPGVSGDVTISAAVIAALAAFPLASTRAGSAVSPAAIAALVAIHGGSVSTVSIARIYTRLGGVLVPVSLQGAVNVNGVAVPFH